LLGHDWGSYIAADFGLLGGRDDQKGVVEFEDIFVGLDLLGTFIALHP
jgi:hypothetical protein